MAKPTKFKTQFPNGLFCTCIVLDKEDFDDLCRTFIGVLNVGSGSRISDKEIKQFIDANYIPLMAKGSKTKYIFDKFGIETDLASFIVRGFGMSVLRESIAQSKSLYPSFSDN